MVRKGDGLSYSSYLFLAVLLCLTPFIEVRSNQDRNLAPTIPNPSIKTRYDRFSDLTSISLSLPVIGGIVELGLVQSMRDLRCDLSTFRFWEYLLDKITGKHFPR